MIERAENEPGVASIEEEGVGQNEKPSSSDAKGGVERVVEIV